MPSGSGCWSGFFKCLQKTEVVVEDAADAVTNVVSHSKVFLDALIAVFGQVSDQRTVSVIQELALQQRIQGGVVADQSAQLRDVQQRLAIAERNVAAAQSQAADFQRQARQARQNATYFQDAFEQERAVTQQQNRTVAQLVYNHGILAETTARQADTIQRQASALQTRRRYHHRIVPSANTYLEEFEERTVVYRN